MWKLVFGTQFKVLNQTTLYGIMQVDLRDHEPYEGHER